MTSFLHVSMFGRCFCSSIYLFPFKVHRLVARLVNFNWLLVFVNFYNWKTRFFERNYLYFKRFYLPTDIILSFLLRKLYHIFIFQFENILKSLANIRMETSFFKFAPQIYWAICSSKVLMLCTCTVTFLLTYFCAYFLFLCLFSALCHSFYILHICSDIFICFAPELFWTSNCTARP